MPTATQVKPTERRFTVTLDMTDDGQDFTEFCAEHGIVFRKIGNCPHGWDTEFSSLTREALVNMINQWWHSGDPETDALYLSEIRPAQLTEAQRSQIMLLLVGVGMPEAMAGVLEENLTSMPWPEVADSLRVDGGLEPNVIEALRQIVGAEPIRFPQCTRTYLTRGGRADERCEETCDEHSACSRCGAASCEAHNSSYPVYDLEELKLPAERLAELKAQGITSVCEDCLTPEEQEAL